MILRSSIAGAIALVFLIHPAEEAEAKAVAVAAHHARHHHHVHHHRTIPGSQTPSSRCNGTTYDNDGRTHCAGGFHEFSPSPLEGHGRVRERTLVRHGGAKNNARSASWRGEIIAHPRGCPPVLFCGCGAAVEVFGRPIRSLWLAANWFRFPRAAPGPGMAAVRQHHVMIIREYLGGDHALVYDANSGHRLTRVHVVSLRGYRIVNPRSG